MRNIVHVIDHWGLGGAQRLISNLARIDKANNHQVIALFEHHQFFWPLAPEQISFLGGSYSGTPLLRNRLKLAVTRRNPDLVVVHLNGSRWAMGSFKPDCPVIWWEHSCEELPRKLGPTLGRLIEGQMKNWAHTADVVVSLSQYGLDYAQTHYGFSEAQSHVIPAPPAWDLVRKPQKDDHIFTLGFFGRISPQKGWRDLMPIFKALDQLQMQWKCIVLGDGPELNSLKKQCEPFGDKFEFDSATLLQPDHFHQIDVLLMPSRYEPFGLVAHEALCCGVAVVGYRVGGLPEVLEQDPHSILVEPGNINQLVSSVLDIHDNLDEIRAAQPASQTEPFLKRWRALVDNLVVHV